MTENPKKTKIPKRAKTPKGTSTLESVNKDILTMFQTTIHMLEQTIMTAKINPAQGILGMMMIADLLHGGAYTVPNVERPYLVGKRSIYYGDIPNPASEVYPWSGFNWLDPLGSIGALFQAGAETNFGITITAEVYMNANVPHKFPKLLSDETFAKIMVSGAYLIHENICTQGYNNLKTYVEASAIPLKAAAELVKDVGQTVKSLAPLAGVPAEGE
jgi:hypothetical protein